MVDTMTRARPNGGEDDTDDSDGRIDQNNLIHDNKVHLSVDDDDLDEGEEDGKDEVCHGDVHKMLDLPSECRGTSSLRIDLGL